METANDFVSRARNVHLYISILEFDCKASQHDHYLSLMSSSERCEIIYGAFENRLLLEIDWKGLVDIYIQRTSIPIELTRAISPSHPTSISLKGKLKDTVQSQNFLAPDLFSKVARSVSAPREEHCCNYGRVIAQLSNICVLFCYLKNND